MALSKADKDVLASQLGEEVEQFLEDFTQDWQSAAEYATANANDPQDDDSNLYWGIAFAGNLLWALTACFPPAGTVKVLEISWRRATQVVSIFGAAAGSNVLGQFGAVSTGHWSLAGMKIELSKKFSRLRGPMKEVYVQGAKEWVEKSLLGHALEKAGIRPEDASVTRDSATIAVLGTAQRNERRLFTWTNYIFPNNVAYSENSVGRSAILGDYMRDQIDSALNDFNRQWAAYQNANIYAAKGRRPAFRPTLHFSGVPEAVQGGVKKYINQHKLTPQESWNALLQKMGIIKGAPTVLYH